MKNDTVFKDLIGFLEELKNIREIINIHGYEFLVLVISKYIYKCLGITNSRQQRIYSFLALELFFEQIMDITQIKFFQKQQYPSKEKKIISQINDIASVFQAPLYYLEISHIDEFDEPIILKISHTGVWNIQTDPIRLASIEEIMFVLDSILCNLDGESTTLVKILMGFLYIDKHSALTPPSGVLLLSPTIC